MSGYANQNFQQRYGILGEIAENAFERWAIVNDLKYVQRGWNRPPLARFFKVSPVDRATPDYVLETADNHYYIDCKGTGSEDFVKIKQESLDHLGWWQTQHDVWFFVWNSKIKKHVFLKYTNVVELCKTLPKKTFENDGKTYYEVPTDFEGGTHAL